jgi:hypothetical protein
MHGEIDVGLAALAATMPKFMAFEEESKKASFQAQGVMTAVTSLTEFKPVRRRAVKGRRSFRDGMENAA